MIRSSAILAMIGLAAAALATAPIRPAELSARPGRIVETHGGTEGTGDGWIAVDGYMRTTGIVGQVRFEPTRRCRILGVEFVARTTVSNTHTVPTFIAIPDPDYTIAASNMHTSARTNWVETCNPWSTDSGQITYGDAAGYILRSVGDAWSHWIVTYDPAATPTWQVWKNGARIVWHNKRRNQATSWNPDGMFRVWFVTGIGSPATQTELQFFRPFMAPAPPSADAHRRAYMRWKGTQQ